MRQKTRKLKARKIAPKANTHQVLGNTQDLAAINPKWQRQYKHLLALRDYVLRQRGAMEEVAREEQPAFSLHMADAGTSESDRDLAISLISSEQDALYEIEAALDRIRNGNYGICELTGKPIERARLASIPWARFSAKAQRELETQRAIKPPQPDHRGIFAERLGLAKATDEEAERDQESE
jgi:RNA polymerase-binding transcription factor DksA